MFPKKQNANKKERKKYWWKTMRELFFILLPALAGICPHYSLTVSQVKTLYHITPET